MSRPAKTPTTIACGNFCISKVLKAIVVIIPNKAPIRTPATNCKVIPRITAVYPLYPMAVPTIEYNVPDGKFEAGSTATNIIPISIHVAHKTPSSTRQ